MCGEVGHLVELFLSSPEGPEKKKAEDKEQHCQAAKNHYWRGWGSTHILSQAVSHSEKKLAEDKEQHCKASQNHYTGRGGAALTSCLRQSVILKRSLLRTRSSTEKLPRTTTLKGEGLHSHPVLGSQSF